MYHNTTDLFNQDLLDKQQMAKSQDEKIYNFIKNKGVFSSSRVWVELYKINDDTTFKELKKLPKITSVRRSIDTLYNLSKVRKIIGDDGYLKVKGVYGPPEFLYEVV